MPARLTVNLFDGTRRPFNAAQDLLLTVLDGNQNVQHRDFHRAGSIEFADLPTFDNFGDRYTVIASARKHLDAGFAPLQLSPSLPQALDLMLLPKKSQYNFTNARWQRLRETQPALTKFLAQGAASEGTAQGFYEELMDKDGDAAACLLNLATVMSDIHLPVGRAFDYFKAFIWDKKQIGQDRFYAFADVALLTQMKLAVAQRAFAPAFGFQVTHPGATDSFKQVQFGEANLQLTIYGNERQQIGGVECVKVETDIDYFKDPLAHFFIEVIPNLVTRNKTNPKAVYVLRWIAGRRFANVSEFAPPYTIEAV